MEPMGPESGDIVVRHETRDGRDRFLLRVVPNDDQFVLPSRTEALQQAVAFAERQRVRVWLLDGSDSATLIADFRGGTPA